MEKSVSLELKKLHSLFDSAQENPIFNPELKSQDSSLLIFLQQLQSKDTYAYNLENYYAKQHAYLQKEWGLNYSFDALQNFKPSQQDVEDNILYQRRFQNGLEWNVLKDGYFDTKNQLKSLSIEQAFEQELTQLSYTKKNIPLKMNQCIYWFNNQKSAYLKIRLALLNQQLEAIQNLYFAKKLTKDFVLKNQTRIAEINAMNGIYSSYNEQISPIFDSTQLSWDAPLFDLNYQAILGDLDHKNNLDSLSAQLFTQIDQQSKWYYDVRLKTYLRHSYYDLLTTNPNSRSFFSAGIGASIPLSFNNKEQAELEKEKVYKRIESLQNLSTDKRIELLNEAYEYRYQLKQYLVFHQKRILTNEAIRQERVKAKLLDADFNPLHGLELIDELLQIEIELLDLKQNLYIKLLKIQEKVKSKSIQEITVPLSLPNYFEFEAQTGRNCYVWSKTFDQYDINFISEYIVYNQFDEIQLAISSEDTHLDQKIKLIELLKAKNIKVDLMIGQNNLLDAGNSAQVIEKMIQQFPLDKINGIHLDIEPHTRDDWKKNQETLKNKYKSILKETKSLSQTYKIKLSIDLPLSLDTLYVKEIMQEVNTVRFMCYENIKEDYLVRKLNPYFDQKEKLAISIRTEDFNSRNEMEAFTKKISELTQIKTINFHDLNRLIELDKKSLNSDEEH